MLDPDASMRLIGLMGAMLAGAAMLGLTKNPCGHDECARTCARLTQEDKVRQATKLHPQHLSGIPNRDCSRCQDKADGR